MLEEDPGGGFIPPSWMRDDFTAWLIGWAMEKQRGMREALAERKKATSGKNFPVEEDEPGEDFSADAIMAAQEDG